jgi:ABC-type oligopeptide transport system ATPase subunit
MKIKITYTTGDLTRLLLKDIKERTGMMVVFSTMDISEDDKESNRLGIVVEADINEHDKDGYNENPLFNKTEIKGRR